MGTTMDVRDVGIALWRQRWLVVVVLLVTLGAAAVGISLAPKAYTATATVTATAAPSSSASADELDALRATVADLAGSQSVATAVATELDGRRSVGDLREEIHGHWVRGTVLVDVDVEDRDPRLAARIADLVAAELGQQEAGGSDLVVAPSDPAAVPSAYSSPDRDLVAVIALVVALGLAMAAAVARDRRIHTVARAEEVEAAATAPLLAHLPAPDDLTEMPTLEPGTATADTFRHLRIAVAESTADRSGPVVMASIAAGDINVWLGANAAIALAGSGRQVLLVDGRMGERFGRPLESEPDTPGLYDVLLGSADLDSATSPGPVDQLSVLPSGTWGDQPVDELIRRRFAEVMAQATADYDAVVVLGPPLEVCDDSRAMAIGGALVLAVVEGEVSAYALRVHADRVRAAGARLLGVVLVAARPRRSGWSRRSRQPDEAPV